ncbi:hypothetical protein EJ08DRAFT_701883 [Tothia fuscella]|uniref:Helicase C-terminal domain-containing protein n=1 Tax=Tothia fuscella TaxID=1048955 RepID=A0A9P4NHL1_9PEZI|nr:hypothetical protein EJ08DRAFT_701883 [Tothia fuscella]
MQDRLDSEMNDPAFQVTVPLKRRRGKDYASAKQSKKLKDQPDVNAEVERPEGRITSQGNDSERGFEWLKTPLFHLFRWNRLVIDEVALITNKSSRTFSSLAGLEAEKKWVLCGTPSLDDFHDIKMIARLIGVELAVDVLSPGFISNYKIKSLRDEMSNAEKFQSFQESRTLHWHLQRHHYAQNFLDIFVRSNDAALAHIDERSHLRVTKLGPSHRAVYQELTVGLDSVNVNLREKSKHLPDREDRINKSLVDCQTIEEALVRSAEVFDGTRDLYVIRTAQFKAVKDTLRERLLEAEQLGLECNDPGGKYGAWKKVGAEDSEATTILQRLIREARGAATKPKSKTGAKKVAKELHEEVSNLRQLTRELTTTIRSLRYVERIRTLQTSTHAVIKTGRCEGPCARSDLDPAQLRLLSLCGHLSCTACLGQTYSDYACPVDGCIAGVAIVHTRSPEDFVGTAEDGVKERTFGSKLDAIAKLIVSCPPQDQVLLFVQDNMLIEEAQNCLGHHGITYGTLSTDKNEEKARTAIEKFQDTDSFQVLIVSLDSDHVTGLNLTNANHVIFLAPYHAKSQYEYSSKMLQAIRRAHRFGQEKIVHVYHFVTLNTVDVDILQAREIQLTTPLWQSPSASENTLSATRIVTTEGKAKSRLVNHKGRFALAPKKWVKQHKEEILDKDYSAHVQLSVAYEAYEDGYVLEDDL